MFDGRDFLRVARTQLGPESSDAEYRTAIGRAYYSAFLHARTCEEQRNHTIFPKSGQAHFLVRKSLRDVYPRLAHDLDDLRRLRNRADYDLHYSEAHDDAADVVERAHILIKTLEGDWEDTTPHG